MTIHTFRTELWLPRGRDAVFPFFADARNLQAITPPWVHFTVLTPDPIVMRPGALIDYRLRVHGFPLRWRTEITVWEPPARFVDVQRHGPYRLWEHEHGFEEHAGGTRCRDLVRYSVLGGRWVDRLFVRRDVERIFAFRQARLLALLGAGVPENVPGVTLSPAG
jgi:ligand-binding SRPBCC domain-containing protein